jgi:hypothetical protein
MHSKGILPCLVQAFIEGEDSKAVPVDQIEISDLKNTSALMLPSGKIIIKVVNRTGKVIHESSVDMARNRLLKRYSHAASRGASLAQLETK